MPILRDNIIVLDDMVKAFDVEQPSRGSETTAFIKRWRRKELEQPHGGGSHKSLAVNGINAAQIETIRNSKKFRDAPKMGGSRDSTLRD